MDLNRDSVLAKSPGLIEWHNLIDQVNQVPELLRLLRTYETLLRTLHAVDVSLANLIAFNSDLRIDLVEDFFHHAVKIGLVETAENDKYRLSDSGNKEIGRVRDAVKSVLGSAFGAPQVSQGNI